MIAIENSTNIDLNLHQHEILNISGSKSVLSIECEQGIVWITNSGDNNDHTIEAGQIYIARAPGTLVIEAIRDSVINLKDAEPAAIP